MSEKWSVVLPHTGFIGGKKVVWEHNTTASPDCRLVLCLNKKCLQRPNLKNNADKRLRRTHQEDNAVSSNKDRWHFCFVRTFWLVLTTSKFYQVFILSNRQLTGRLVMKKERCRRRGFHWTIQIVVCIAEGSRLPKNKTCHFVHDLLPFSCSLLQRAVWGLRHWANSVINTNLTVLIIELPCVCLGTIW